MLGNHTLFASIIEIISGLGKKAPEVELPIDACIREALDKLFWVTGFSLCVGESLNGQVEPSVFTVFQDRKSKVATLTKEFRARLKTVEGFNVLKLNGKNVYVVSCGFPGYGKDGSQKRKIHFINVESEFTEEDFFVLDLICYSFGAFLETRAKEVISKIRYKELHEFMFAQEKLSSLGRMVNSMSHEVNNPLGIIQNAMTILLSEIDELDDGIGRLYGNTPPAEIIESQDVIRKMADTVERNARRIHEITTALANSSGFVDANISEISVKHAIEEGISFCLDKFSKEEKSSFVINWLRADNCTACAAHTVFVKMIGGILDNAFYAMIERTISQEGHRPLLELKLIENDGKITIEIRDNGSGIKREYLSRVEEPFFTTKPTGMGTGLGLTVARNVITIQMKGQMVIESDPNRGTVVRLSFSGQRSSKAAGAA